jgi:hypothetical protein
MDEDNFKFELTGDEHTDKILEVINIQGVMTRRMVRSEVKLINKELEVLKKLNEADHKVMKDHDAKQNGHIKDQGEALRSLADRFSGHVENHNDPSLEEKFVQHIVNHPVEDKDTCPAYKTDSWVKKNWWKLILVIAGVFLVMEWLYHDSDLFLRISGFIDRLKWFKS